MWPVILRELKSSARQRGTYYLRMLAATEPTDFSWLTPLIQFYIAALLLWRLHLLLVRRTFSFRIA